MLLLGLCWLLCWLLCSRCACAGTGWGPARPGSLTSSCSHQAAACQLVDRVAANAARVLCWRHARRVTLVEPHDTQRWGKRQKTCDIGDTQQQQQQRWVGGASNVSQLASFLGTNHGIDNLLSCCPQGVQHTNTPGLVCSTTAASGVVPAPSAPRPGLLPDSASRCRGERP